MTQQETADIPSTPKKIKNPYTEDPKPQQKQQPSAEKPPLFMSNTKVRNTPQKKVREYTYQNNYLEYDSPPALPEKNESVVKFELLQRLVNAIDVSDNSPTMKQHRITQRSIYNLDPQSSLALVQMRSEAAASVNVVAAGGITSFTGSPSPNAANNGFFHLQKTKSLKKLGKSTQGSALTRAANERNHYQQQLTGIHAKPLHYYQHKSHQSSGIMSPVVSQQFSGSFSKTIEHGNSKVQNQLNNYLDGMMNSGARGRGGAGSAISSGGGVLRGCYMAVKLRAGA
ncbi:hypothetical protein FGO68_gene12741 [Halteria grandinella]|uniref:Uncharacterized protein n=1 Tax=Halteria grandinella TaxID=5974 RepID=A0A8J8TAQ2_HALGN|nr:hypothetical protein FGO68_gene12741 [Halteria grandinella]